MADESDNALSASSLAERAWSTAEERARASALMYAIGQSGNGIKTAADIAADAEVYLKFLRGDGNG